MNKWRAVTFLAVPACAGFGIYCFANMEHHHAEERPAYSYLRIGNKIFPWGGDCGLFEYGKCQEE